MKPAEAEPMYDALLSQIRSEYDTSKIQAGIFGANMQVQLVNDGPVTIPFDSRKWAYLEASKVATAEKAEVAGSSKAARSDKSATEQAKAKAKAKSETGSAPVAVTTSAITSQEAEAYIAKHDLQRVI